MFDITKRILVSALFCSAVLAQATGARAEAVARVPVESAFSHLAPGAPVWVTSFRFFSRLTGNSPDDVKALMTAEALQPAGGSLGLANNLTVRPSPAILVKKTVRRPLRIETGAVIEDFGRGLGRRPAHPGPDIWTCAPWRDGL